MVRGELADITETIPSFLSDWSVSHQFFNFGSGGLGTLEIASLYEQFLDEVAHQSVIFFINTSNDLEDNAQFQKWAKLNLKPTTRTEPIQIRESWLDIKIRQIFSKLQLTRLYLDLAVHFDDKKHPARIRHFDPSRKTKKTNRQMMTSMHC